MSESILHVVQFSPRPQIGERLNVAVFGFNNFEREAGAKYHNPQRVELVFGEGSASRVEGVFRGIRHWISSARKHYADPSAHSLVETIVLPDRGLSVSLLPSIHIFDSTLQFALDTVSQRYFVGPYALKGKNATDWGRDLSAICSKILQAEFHKRNLQAAQIQQLLTGADTYLEDLYTHLPKGPTVATWAKGVGREVARNVLSHGHSDQAWEEVAKKIRAGSWEAEFLDLP